MYRVASANKDYADFDEAKHDFAEPVLWFVGGAVYALHYLTDFVVVSHFQSLPRLSKRSRRVMMVSPRLATAFQRPIEHL